MPNNMRFAVPSSRARGCAGNDQALTQVDPIALRLSGYFAFLVWRSVYITKQVSFRNRVLILFDWVKTRAFGRDLSSF